MPAYPRVKLDRTLRLFALSAGVLEVAPLLKEW
jgi:hypothetical protein